MTSRSCSPHAKCQFCEFIEASQWELGYADPSTPQPASACALCSTDPTTFKPWQPSFKRRKGPQPSVCVDPGCSENICEECSEDACEECSNHEESCEDCVSDCRISVCGDGSDCRTHDDYPFDDSYFELFGDQAAQMFNLGGRLPQLPPELVPVGFGGGGVYPDAPTAAGHIGPQNSFGPYDQLELSRAPIQFHTQPQGLEAAVSAYLDGSMGPGTVSALGDEWPPSIILDAGDAVECTASAPVASFPSFNNKHITTHTFPVSSSPLHASNLKNSAESAQGRAVVIAPAHGTLPQESDVAQKRLSPTRPIRPSERCQWVEPNGQSCRKVFELGSDLHEHLKTFHNVNREVFCRWLGCRFGVLGSTPHKYATSVERHTWGHSGYRPYKCPTCSEGFAAANVRDEHFANFHLKRKMFSCDICAHQCTSARNLKRHKDDTHKTERFQCEFCNRNGKIRLFPRGSNLARHFRKCKYVLALFPGATGAATGKIDDDWLPTGYRGGHQGMEKAKVVPPNYLQVPMGV